MTDVFISYARADRERVAPLARALEDHGWSVWWDRDITPGRTFDEEIEEALDEAKVVIAVWTREGVASRWVRTEAAEGLQRNALVPVLFEAVRMPLAFRRVQAADLTTWTPGDDHPGFDLLVSAVNRLMGAAKTNRAPAPTQDPTMQAVVAAEAKAAAEDWEGVIALLQPLESEADDLAARFPRAIELLDEAVAKQELVDLYEEAEVEYAEGRWTRAVEKLERVLERDPDLQHAADLQHRAQRHLEREREERLARSFARATEALEERDYSVAVARLEQLLEEAPDHRDAAAALELARSGVAAEARYRHARNAFQEGRWDEVIAITGAITETSPSFGDPEGLGDRARSGLARDVSDRATALFERGRGFLDSREFSAAAESLQQVLAAWPDRADVRDALDRARAGARSARDYADAQQLFDEEHFAEAIAEVERIIAANPDFGDPNELVARAQRRLASSTPERAEHLESAAPRLDDKGIGPVPRPSRRADSAWTRLRRWAPLWSLGGLVIASAYLPWFNVVGPPPLGVEGSWSAFGLDLSWLWSSDARPPAILGGQGIALAFPIVLLGGIIAWTMQSATGATVRRICGAGLILLCLLHILALFRGDVFGLRGSIGLDDGVGAYGMHLALVMGVLAMMRDPLLVTQRSASVVTEGLAPLGRAGAAVSALGAVLTVAGLILPWQTEPYNGFEVSGLAVAGIGFPALPERFAPDPAPWFVSVGMVVIVAAAAALLVAHRLSRPAAWAVERTGVITLAVILGYGLVLVSTAALYGRSALGFLVDATAPGFWLSLLGAATLALVVPLQRRRTASPIPASRETQQRAG